jgi:hypothetical protein
MPSIITASELRAVLGISSALYSDAVLDDAINASETVILPMLTTFSSPVDAVELSDNVATFHTTLIHEFTEGSSVVIAGVGTPFNGTRVVNSGVTDNTFSCDITNADIKYKNIIPAGTATLTGASTYVGNSAVEQAVLAVAVEIFSSKVAPGGQMEGIDFTNVSPYRLGRSLFNRVSGLLGSYLDVETMAQ